MPPLSKGFPMGCTNIAETGTVQFDDTAKGRVDTIPLLDVGYFAPEMEGPDPWLIGSPSNKTEGSGPAWPPCTQFSLLPSLSCDG